MISRILLCALAAAFLSTATMAPTVVLAAAAKKEETKKDESKKTKKALSPQQQKMKDCAGKWGEEKKAKKVSGRKAYNEFMGGCLKG